MTILEEANDIVNGPRQDNYNHPYDNFSQIAFLWSSLLDITISPEQVGLMMILLKINRENFKHGRDNIVDIAGYAQCVQMIVEEREKRHGLVCGSKGTSLTSPSSGT